MNTFLYSLDQILLFTSSKSASAELRGTAHLKTFKGWGGHVARTLFFLSWDLWFSALPPVLGGGGSHGPVRAKFLCQNWYFQYATLSLHSRSLAALCLVVTDWDLWCLFKAPIWQITRLHKPLGLLHWSLIDGCTEHEIKHKSNIVIAFLIFKIVK